jgi:hypothetical protein
MDRTHDLDQRLASWIRTLPGQGPLYEVIADPGSARIVELERRGEAEVTCPAPGGCRWIHWKLQGATGFFQFLREDKNADGALLLCRQDGGYEAHVIECKRTVDQTKWHEIGKQFLWTLGKLLALAGVLGITLDRVTLGTAFRRDQLSEEESPNPAQGRPVLDGPAAQDDDERTVTEARQRQLAWMNDEVRLPGFARSFRHVKIPLDPQGRGTYRA